LAATAASHWREIRARLILAGIADPLSLTSMHQILDVVESVVIEGMGSNNDIQRYYFRTYRPEPSELANAFTAEESDASFDAFSAALGGMH
jgi:hypothetical protein